MVINGKDKKNISHNPCFSGENDVLAISYTFSLHFLHSGQFPSLELHDDPVQRGALPQCLNPWRGGVALYLLHGLSPLLLGLCHGVAVLVESFFLWLVKLFLGEHLELEYIAVAAGVMGVVWQ